MLPSTPIHCHPLPSTPTHYHLLPLTLTHLQPTPTHFSVFSHPLPLMFNPLLLISNTPPPVRSLFYQSPVHILPHNPTHHLPFQPIFSPLFYVLTYLRAYVPLCFPCLCAYVIHFYALYCLCLYTLLASLSVNTSGLFIYSAFFKNILVIPVFFS